jgi:hypothetical protein
MYSYIKKFLLIISVLVLPTMNVALKAQVIEEEGGNRHHKVHLKEEDQNKGSSAGKQSVPAASVNVEDSWKTYFLSSMKNIATNCIKNIATIRHNFMDYTIHHPDQAIFFGTVLAAKLISCEDWTHCYCKCVSPNQTITFYDTLVRHHG